MPELVAIDLPGGPGFADALRAVWDTGDAAAPLDPRLPPPAAQRLLGALRPTRVVGPDGVITKLDDGLPVDDGDALVVATSGSTGEPRGVVLTHQAIAASARATSARLGIDPARHCWLGCLPLAHIGGLSVVCRALLTGTPLLLLPAFKAEEVAAIGTSGRATHVSLVATALRRIDPGAFECVLLGGAAPPGRGELGSKRLDGWGLGDNIVTTYGMTETGSGVVYDGVPLDGVEVSIGNGLAGGGAMGEILLRGPMLLRAYRDGTDPRIAGPRGLAGSDNLGGTGKWLPTGDGGRLGPDGTLEVDGRLAEVIVTGAEKVWPAEVEGCLAGCPGVREVAIWKLSDPEWGEQVTAWVVPVDPWDPPDLHDLRGHVAATLPKWAAPRQVFYVDSLPRTSSGKVRRSALVDPGL